MNVSSFYIDHKASLVLPDWWLLQLTSRSHDPQRQSQDLSIYGYLVGAAFLLLIIRSATVMNALITSSMNLHNLMLSAVVKAPVLFFDTNPVGRVLNRFSRDINIMEELLPEAFMMALQEVLYCLGAVILQSVLIPWIILPAIPLMVIFALIGRYYLNPSRDLRRLEAVNRSPVLSHFRDSLEGLVTIRAYKKENTSMEALYRFVCIYLTLRGSLSTSVLCARLFLFSSGMYYHLCTIHHVYIALYLSVAIRDTDSPDIPISTASDLAGFEVGVEWKTNDLLPNLGKVSLVNGHKSLNY